MAAQDLVARGIALYGAVIATGGLLWTIRRDVKDRPHLRVRATVPISDRMGFDIIGDFLQFEVVNAGRRTIHLREVGGRYVDGRAFGLAIRPEGSPARWPVKLEPTERVLVNTALPEEPRTVRVLAAWDTLGKEYQVPRSLVAESIQRALRFRKKPHELSLRERARFRLPPWIRV
jgi:hypothetical protein